MCAHQPHEARFTLLVVISRFLLSPETPLGTPHTHLPSYLVDFATQRPCSAFFLQPRNQTTVEIVADDDTSTFYSAELFGTHYLTSCFLNVIAAVGTKPRPCQQHSPDLGRPAPAAKHRGAAGWGLIRGWELTLFGDRGSVTAVVATSAFSISGGAVEQGRGSMAKSGRLRGAARLLAGCLSAG